MKYEISIHPFGFRAPIYRKREGRSNVLIMFVLRAASI